MGVAANMAREPAARNGDTRFVSLDRAISCSGMWDCGAGFRAGGKTRRGGAAMESAMHSSPNFL